MKILTTKDYGYCYGVKRAINKVNELLDEGVDPLYCYGYIIHNDIINNELKQKGVIFTENIDDVPSGSTLIIRAHGISEKILDGIKDKFKIIDMTCPKVKRIHEIAKTSEKLIVYGDPEHPEVKGIVGSSNGECIVINSLKDVNEIVDKGLFDFTLVSQTTANYEKYNEISELLKSKKIVTKVENTICPTTFSRQNQVKVLSKQCDCIIIVGGKNSSNSKKLYDIASKNCDAVLIESYSELSRDFILRRETIGLSSGASTPAEAIEEVRNNMVSEFENQENEVVVNNDEAEFLQAVEGNLNLVRRGKVVYGTITAVNASEIQVDIGSKHSGFIPADEFENDEEPPKVGDEVKAVVVKINDVEGTALLSKKKFDFEKKYVKIKKLFESKEVFPVKIHSAVNGGLITNFNNVRIFIPKSQVSLKREPLLEDYPGTEQSIRIIEFDEKKHRVIGSIKTVLLEEKKQQEALFWEGIEAGQRREGTITSICDFGIFVDLGGVDGLVHVTDISWVKKTPLSDYYKVGDKVTVLVKSANTETKKVSLSMKFPEDNPWNIIRDNYHVGDVIDVTVLRMTQFGAFVSIIPGVDGMIHISQLSNEKVKKVSDILTIGEVVKVKILDININEKKVSLSISALTEKTEEESDSEETIVESNSDEVATEEQTEQTPVAEEPVETTDSEVKTEETSAE